MEPAALAEDPLAVMLRAIRQRVVLDPGNPAPVVVDGIRRRLPPPAVRPHEGRWASCGGWGSEGLDTREAARPSGVPSSNVERLALDAFLATESRVNIARTHLVPAEVSHAGGNQGEAATHLEAARAQFAALQLPRWLEHTECAARRLDVK